MAKTVHQHDVHSSVTHKPNPNQIQITQIEGQYQPKISSCREAAMAEHTAQHSTDTLRNPLPHRQVRALERAYTHTH
eukprot:COSAG06_NODE_41193_length_393_cov_5193.724490_1_plen_76_part_10